MRSLPALRVHHRRFFAVLQRKLSSYKIVAKTKGVQSSVLGVMKLSELTGHCDILTDFLRLEEGSV